MLTQDNKAAAIDTLKRMTAYAKTKNVMVGAEPRGDDFTLLTEVIRGGGAYTNPDVGNFGGDQAHQHDGIKAMFPYTNGNCHMKMLIRLRTISRRRSRSSSSSVTRDSTRSRTNSRAIRTTTSRRCTTSSSPTSERIRRLRPLPVMDYTGRAFYGGRQADFDSRRVGSVGVFGVRPRSDPGGAVVGVSPGGRWLGSDPGLTHSPWSKSRHPPADPKDSSCLGPLSAAAWRKGTVVKGSLEKAFGYQGNNMHLPVKDVAAALPFYETVLGFQLLSRSDAPPTTRPCSPATRSRSDSQKTAAIPRRTVVPSM